MREAIERVISELERAKVEGDLTKIDQWDHGWNKALGLAKDKLKAVLSNHEREHTPEHHIPTEEAE